MKRAIGSLVTVILISAALALAACSSEVTRSGWEASGGGSAWNARFGAFEGVESRTIETDGAQALRLDYRVLIDDGTMTLVLRDPDNEAVWEYTATAGEVSDTEEIPLALEGVYTLFAYGDSATGDLEMSWDRR